MKTFASFEKFSKHLEKVVNDYNKREIAALNFIGKELEKHAKDKIGHLQEGGGPFATWAQLAKSTKLDKEKQGYVFNADYNPLYRTGVLKNSISHVVNKSNHTVFLGSDSEIMVYQELGTHFIPPRSVLGLTMFQSKAYIGKILGKMMVDWISNNRMTFKVVENGSL